MNRTMQQGYVCRHHNLDSILIPTMSSSGLFTNPGGVSSQPNGAGALQQGTLTREVLVSTAYHYY